MGAAMASIDGQPPDLAVEVEHTARQPEKIAVYRDCGVTELWELATESAGREPVIYDLQAKGGPRSMVKSAILPDVRAAQLPAAARALREIGGPLAFAEKGARGEPVRQQLLGVVGKLSR